MDAAEARGLAEFVSTLAANLPTNSAKSESLVDSILKRAFTDADVDSTIEVRDALVKLIMMRPCVDHSRAAMLQLEASAVLMSSRIVSDLRPVFTASDDEDPSYDDSTIELRATTIVHNLVLTSRGPNGEEQTAFYALDPNDLRDLQRVINRALKKHELLEEAAQRASIPVMRPWQEYWDEEQE